MTNKRSKNEQTPTPEPEIVDPREQEAPEDREVLDGPDAREDAPSQAIALRNPGALAAIADPDIAQIITDNLGSDRMDVRSLPTVRIPTGGNQFWTVPTLEGPEARKALDGVIIHWTPMRAKWDTQFDDAPNSPPTCTSSDGITGFGDNGTGVGDVTYTADGVEVRRGKHDCETCPLNQFGTKVGKDGKLGDGKQCRESRVMFVLGEGALLPMAVPLSPMSIKPAREYFQRLTSGALPYYKVETSIGLEEAKNGAGITYSKATLKMKRRLEPGEVEVLADYRAKILPVLGAIPVETILVRDDVARED